MGGNGRIGGLSCTPFRNRRGGTARGGSERGAWVEWLYFFLLGVAEQAQDAASRARPAEFIIPRMKLENWPISFR